MSKSEFAMNNHVVDKKRILVTGAAGFLGSHLCDRLIEFGHDVVGLDNFSSGRRSNLKQLRDNHHFEIVRHDVTQPFFGDFDEVYHLASPASPPFYQANPIATTKINFLGTYHMLGLARRHGAKIFHSSTSEVYGDPEVHPQEEGYRGSVNPIGPRSCYDEGKRVAESLCFDYHRMHKTRIKVVRIFNTYGPRMNPNDGRVVSNFIVQALLGKDITLYGDGQQTRSFCYVSDLISGFLLMMNTDDSVTGPINLGNPDEFTVRELAEKVIDLTGSKSKLVHKPLPVDDPRQRQPDITRARSALGWEPQYALEDGLKLTIEFFDKALAESTINISVSDDAPLSVE